MDYTITLHSLRTGAVQHINNVIADGIIESVRVRWFLTSSGQRHEVPLEGFRIEFGEERAKIQEEQDRQKAQTA